MVGQVVGAVAPVVVQSATSEDGLINKLFKIAILLGVLVKWPSQSGALFIFETDVQSAVTGFFLAPINFLAGVLPLGVSAPFRILSVGLTGLASGFAFRR